MFKNFSAQLCQKFSQSHDLLASKYQAKVSQAHGFTLAWPILLGLPWPLASRPSQHITSLDQFKTTKSLTQSQVVPAWSFGVSEPMWTGLDWTGLLNTIIIHHSNSKDISIISFMVKIRSNRGHESPCKAWVTGYSQSMKNCNSNF